MTIVTNETNPPRSSISHECIGWPGYQSSLEGADKLGLRFRAGAGVSVFRTANVFADAGIFIGDDVMLFDGVRLLLGDADTRLVIGDRVVINVGSYISGEGGLEIGSDVLIGPHVKLLSAGHEVHQGQLEIGRNPIIGNSIRIGRGAWIGAGAIVLPGITIGEGAVVGAGSIVLRDIPTMAVAAGNPARILHKRGYREGDTLTTRMSRRLRSWIGM